MGLTFQTLSVWTYRYPLFLCWIFQVGIEHSTPHFPDKSVKYKDGLLASLLSEDFAAYHDKSFNVDNYCFDSQPELDMFHTLLEDERIRKVWFTGMLTAGQTEFIINYIDPESNTVRSYYPDFLIQKNDGSYIIIEVKGDNKLDDAVVLAKKEYAKQIATASNMDYVIVPGSKCRERLMLTE